jgi:hypothetical protein
MAQAWAWDGSAQGFLNSESSTWLAALEEHHAGLLRQQPSQEQRRAWIESSEMLVRALRRCQQMVVGLSGWGVVLEYELPLEGGRRPDAVILAGSTVVVVEFKSAPVFSTANIDQVRAYARDIGDYHSASRDLEVAAILASTSGQEQRRVLADVLPAGTPEQLAGALMEVAAGPQLDRLTWLAGTYAPLPTIIDAARRIFRDEPLPRIWRAESVGVHETVRVVQDRAEAARANGERVLALIAGVPGAGKTLAGLRIVYEHEDSAAPATFLSGNGPLVAVLQDALKSSVFVKDLHKAVHAYGMRGQIPQQHVIVFDEAQRAWDRGKMHTARGLDFSEPDVLIAAAERIPEWATLVGLVGEGQEIHGGEEGGLGQWADAIAAGQEHWKVVVPPRLARVFTGFDVQTDPRLDLTTSLRSRRAERLHDWVSHLLEGRLEIAHELANEIDAGSFPIRLFRNLEAAKDYARERYDDEPGKLFGLLASSHAKNLPGLGVDNSFQTTKRVQVARWFNDPADSPRSGRALTHPLTEFMCQGLELDLPVVCWGSDMLWGRDGWSIRPTKRRFPLRDPDQIVRNTYRVLLTRGRDGLVLFVPPGAVCEQTAQALIGAGAWAE